MQHLTLLELNEKIKSALSANLAPSYWVVSEIGEIRLAQNGHCYLELIDKEDGLLRAKSKATLWSYAYRNLNGWFEAITGSPLRQGMKILANVQVSFHEQYGLSLNIRDIDANFTLGDREKKKRETMARLIHEGVHEMNKMHTLPIVPQKLAVVSSTTAAGYEDFMHSMTASPYLYDITLLQATMQGDQSATSIIKALHHAAQEEFDLLIIIRGGGAQMDLDTFNDYELCAHIAQFPIPVITGIGHERDETIADMVAHTRLKTPTAVAEFIIAAFRTYHENLYSSLHHIRQMAGQMLQENQGGLNYAKQELKYLVSKAIAYQHKNIGQHRLNISHGSAKVLAAHDSKVKQLAVNLQRQVTIFLKDRHQQLLMHKKLIGLSDPEHVLKKGYSYSTYKGVNIGKVGPMATGETITTITSDQIFTSTLQQQQPRHGKKGN